MKPEFSIIIPTYNRVNTLGRAIESVLNQTYKGFELIVIDDGSEDFTVDFIRKFPKVLYRFQKNQGVGRARNLGSEIATKEWLVFLDSDDELTISALSNFEKQIELNPNFNLFVAGNERKTTVGSEVNIPKEGKYYPILSGTFCIRKEIFEKVGGYDPQFTFSENTELFHRIGQLNLNVKPFYIPLVSLIYHESTICGSRNSENIVYSVNMFLNKHKHTMSSHHRHLYHQILGVNQLRFRRFGEARKNLWKAYQLKPTQLKTLCRLMLSFLPVLSKKVYSKQIIL